MRRTDDDFRAIQEKAEEKYERHGQQAVYEYADMLGLPYSKCWQCETDTPDLDFSDKKSCMVCGQTKTHATETNNH